MWQHNVYYVCVTFSVVRYVGLHSELKWSIAKTWCRWNDNIKMCW